jgi:CcmD family protein
MNYLLAGTGVVWIGIFLYVLSLLNRQKRVEEELAELRAFLADKEGKV